MIKREVTYRKGAAKKETRILISHGMNIICMHCGNKCSKHTFYLMDSKIPLYYQLKYALYDADFRYGSCICM
jgi:hypothetical protein